jgi:trans-aconitate 2-methyltransferase
MLDPQLYAEFTKKLYAQPVFDLISRLPKEFKPNSIIDLGCRSGDTTKHLASTFTKAKIVGIDSSNQMIEQAKVRFPKLNFQCARLEDFNSKADLIFSNAALHWVGHSEELISKLIAGLNSGGILLVQTPLNFETKAHILLRQLISENQDWYNQLHDSVIFATFRNPEDYYDIFQRRDLTAQVWSATYYQQFPHTEAIFEWLKSPIICEFREKLAIAEIEKIFEKFVPLLKFAYPPRSKTGKIIVPFSRLFYLVQKI